jgi:hypothetical protein
MVVPLPAGGPTDSFARVLAEHEGQTVRCGAGIDRGITAYPGPVEPDSRRAEPWTFAMARR